MLQFIRQPMRRTHGNHRSPENCRMPTLALALIAILGALTASTLSAEPLTIELSGFEGVSAAEGIVVQITTGAKFAVIAESEDDRQLDYLSLDVTRGVLEIEMDDGFGAPDWVKGDKVEIRVAMPSLVRTEALSGARVMATTMSGSELNVSATSGASIVIDTAEGGSMLVRLTSGANVTVASGSCLSLNAEVSGGSLLGMSSVLCGDVEIEAASGSTASVHAEKAVDANVSGGAKILVYGAPQATKTSNSGGGAVVLR